METKYKNNKIRNRTGTETLEVILRKIRLKQLECVRMDDIRIPKQTLTWFPEDSKTKSIRPKKSWSDTIKDDVNNFEMIWDDFEKVTDDRSPWRSCVDQCATACGRTKVHWSALTDEKIWYTLITSDTH